jgi:hypothetical protein
MRTRSVLWSAFVGIFLLQTALVFTQAASLAPGTVLSPVTAESDPAGGTVLFTTGPVSFSAATFSGTLISTVLSGDSSNPYGGLTFTFEMSNDSTSTDDIVRLTLGSFGGWLVDAGYNPSNPSGGLAPGAITRSPNGQVVGFDFQAPSLAPGGTSALLVLQTDAPGFTPAIASFIDASTAMATTVAPVPEPSVLVLILSGFLILSWMRGPWRNRARS